MKSGIKKVASTCAPATRHYEDKKTTVFFLPALGITAVATVLAAVLKDEFLTTGGTFLFLINHTIGHIFFQSAGDAILPGVDALFLHIEVLYQFDYILYGHAVTQDAGNEFGIVPILLVEGA